ncbi:hypothetical protein CAPTEDRAFT_186056 [Capitella teleta]|uniref:Uncharacterized protein n=1 Tax=Capitella teleta TaxID=283909 RepID=R7UE03_CAPTE|nr:hypothetical protein CAPTEDRAFT_186056 [Capitella teleta]|eukprot:ELU04769.1 hypothetical protein CAPTEDRAFT_186056 [Capitella teleta]
MVNSVRDFVSKYDLCQKNSQHVKLKTVPLTSISVPANAWYLQIGIQQTERAAEKMWIGHYTILATLSFTPMVSRVDTGSFKGCVPCDLLSVESCQPDVNWEHEEMHCFDLDDFSNNDVSGVLHVYIKKKDSAIDDIRGRTQVGCICCMRDNNLWSLKGDGDVDSLLGHVGSFPRSSVYK